MNDFIPVMRQEEAKLLIMTLLSNTPDNALTSSDIKSNFQRLRRFGEDYHKANVRDEPRFFSIVQNAIDRLDTNDAFYRSAYTSTDKINIPQIVRLTGEGAIFARRFSEYLDLLNAQGFANYHFFNNEFLSGKIQAALSKHHLKPVQFEKSLKSRAYANEFHRQLEEKKVFDQWKDQIRQLIDAGTLQSSTDIKSLDMWFAGRDHFDFFDFRLPSVL